MKYYVDYFDFYLGGIGHRMVLKNREQRLKFDVLCINPSIDVLVFTLSETLLEDSNRILTKYDEFWKKGIFKIALAKKYKNLHSYIEERLNILNSLGMENDNFEKEIYSSEIPAYFIDEYLRDQLNLKKGRDCIIYRTSNADINNRVLFKNRICNCGNGYDKIPIKFERKILDKIVYDLVDRCNDKKQIFQREYILKDIFTKYPDASKNRTFFYNLFDQNYNDAMALSVDAIRLSTMRQRLNGSVLFEFLFYFDSSFCKKINSLSPHQIYMLVQNISWQKFVEEINDLYVFLFNVKNVSCGHSMYYYIKWRYDLFRYVYNYLVFIMDWIVGRIEIPEPYWRAQYEIVRCNTENIMEMYSQRFSYIFYITSEIIKKKRIIIELIDDIMGEAEYGNNV